MNPPICKRCLLSEIDPQGLYETVRRRIAQMPDDEKADERTYRARLECCTRCEMLQAGICGLCGCYAELRAAKIALHCPHEQHKW